MNINNINVNKYPVSQVFDPDSKVIFEIPKYQREYTWGTREWEALFDDLIENDDGYFLGSIICINSATDSINAPKFEVVDGQQRLTTLSLFLSALYTTLNSNKELLDEDQQADILQLKRKIVLKKTQSDIRVVPQVQGSNRDDYLGLLAKIGIIPKRPMPNFAGLRRIVKAYNYFLKRINATLEETDDKVAGMFKILDKVNAAIMVMIEVSNHADAYTLFESLNNRGTPLTSVDLIKNLLLARLDVSGEENLDYYFTRWTEILGNLGEEYSEQERFFRQNYNAFRKSLNAPFVKGDRQYPLGTIATRSTMLDIYEKLITRDPVGALDELSENAAIYAGIILNKTDGLTPAQRDSYQDLQRVQGAPSYLLLMYLIKNSDALRSPSSLATRWCCIPTTCLVSPLPMMVSGVALSLSRSTQRLPARATSRITASTCLTMPVKAFWLGSSKVPRRSSSWTTRLLFRPVCRMPLMNTVTKTTGLATSLQTSARWMIPARKAPRRFIRPTEITLWTATSISAARQTSTLRWRRLALSVSRSTTSATLRACA